MMRSESAGILIVNSEAGQLTTPLALDPRVLTAEPGSR